MRIWGKSAEKESTVRGVARAALKGASRKELLQEALHSLSQMGPAGRIGVWLESEADASPLDEMASGFHGMVWDSGTDKNSKEWNRLSIEPPLPVELLLRGKTVEQDLQTLPPNPLLGVLVGLRHALWIPIERKEQLRGVILSGSTGKQPAISREQVESVAAELALALGVDEEQRLARLRTEDLGAVRRFLARQAGAASEESLLSSLVESCTELPPDGKGSGAAFAVIGELREQRGTPGESTAIEFRWCSGDDSWMHAIESKPVANVWRRALEARRAIGSESPIGRKGGLVARIVAFPLESEGQLLGTLVAGLPGSALSLATFDRLELRAVMAAFALGERRKREKDSRHSGWQDALLDCIREPLLLLDNAGRITAASRGARELTGFDSPSSRPETGSLPAQAHLAELFCERDREHLRTWLRAALAQGAEKYNNHPPFPRTTVRSCGFV